MTLRSLSLPAAALAVALALIAARGAAAVKPLTDFEDGRLSFYGGAPDGMEPSSPSYGTKEGSCGFGTIPKDSYPYFSVAGIAPSNHFAQAGPLDACGQCFQIQCTDKRAGACKFDSSGQALSILVMVSDSCPECPPQNIDVQALSFAKIADPKLGRIDMAYRRVECAPPADMQVAVMNFAGAGGWLSLAVADTGGRGAVKQLSIKGSNSDAWRDMTNTWGATWELSSAPSPPLDFRFVCDDSVAVTAANVIDQNGGISGGMRSPVKFSSGVQFPIADPAAKQVKSFEGGSDPMLIDSSTPGNTGGGSGAAASPPPAGGGGGGPSGSNSSCNDVTPPGGYSCEQQKGFGKCGEAFMSQSNFCEATCGRCTSSIGDKQEKQVKSFGGQSQGGRKLLVGLATVRLQA